MVKEVTVQAKQKDLISLKYNDMTISLALYRKQKWKMLKRSNFGKMEYVLTYKSIKLYLSEEKFNRYFEVCNTED